MLPHGADAEVRPEVRYSQLEMSILHNADSVPDVDVARTGELALRLEKSFVGMRSVVVALSGGVDSALVAVVAARTLGPRSHAVTGVSPSYPEFQRGMVDAVVERFGLAHSWIDTREIENPRYVENAQNRCYFCKDELYSRLSALALERGYDSVVDGTNVDDLSDHRPGRVAATEHGVRSPLIECGFGKRDVRALARVLDVPVWDAPASACLASRIPHGTPVTIARLDRVERAEAALRRLGFRQVRVRHHEDVARIELAADELSRAEDPDTVRCITEAVLATGFAGVVVDPKGYRSRE